jgi:aryl-alcohol dehydrogenase-like predicted oxidoreductase
VLSNNFSLARMVDPVWRGCVAASDAESRAFLAKHDIALMPWSSQARGFFLRADRAFTDDQELTRCWYSDDNFQRLERARELAKAKGVLPIQIALAYVLNQPFATFPLIGPRQISETASSLQGLDIALTPQEVAYLNLEADKAAAAR